VNLMAPSLLFPTYVMRKFVFEDFLATIQSYRITNIQVAPPILIMLDKRPEVSKYDLSSVKHILCGAAPLGKELQRAVKTKLNCNIIQGWGMTEVTCGSILVPGGRYDESGSVGLLIPNTEIKVCDDDGNEVTEGQPGEMHVRAPNVCLGYWRNEQATKDTLDKDGWLQTGDVAVVRDNWFWIVDRKKELIKVNALQVAPAELEGVLVENDTIADAAVTGIQLGGEEWPRAYVALKDEYKGKVTEKEVQEWMKGKVAKHKQLVGGVMFVDEVPKLASGKIQRKVMREWAKRDALKLDKGTRPRL
jgi:4-coumarate--CoA ligase